jgi:hydratase-aldolase
MTRCKLTPDDIKGVYALIPACATANAASVKETDTVDRDALAHLTDKLINDGVHGIVMTGNTRETIRKTKFAEDVGADGVMNGTPMYLPTSIPNALQYYRDIAEACPKMAIMIYHNPYAFRFTITPPVWEELVKIPNVIAAKQGSMDLLNLLASIQTTQGKLAVLVFDVLMYPLMQMGASGGWSSDVCMGPSLSLKQYDACVSGDWKLAGQIGADRFHAFVTSLGIPLEELQVHQVAWTKLSVDAAGYGRVGPGRPPFVETPAKVAESAQAYAKRWLELTAKYR